jgi:hypothetical protein
VRTLLVALVVLPGLPWLAGCPAPAKGPSASEIHMQKENEITALWTQIRQFRHEAGMDLDPAPLLISAPPKSVSDAKRVCPDNHKVPQSCNDICSLAENICDNAEAICGLADELGKQDDFAQSKCTSAKASCREAKQRCCGCSDKVPSTGATF